jgi:hypothetical protein
MKTSRRELARILAVAPVLAQAQTPAPAPATPDDELKAARERTQNAVAQTARVKLTPAVEPAFTFQA